VYTDAAVQPINIDDELEIAREMHPEATHPVARSDAYTRQPWRPKTSYSMAEVLRSDTIGFEWRYPSCPQCGEAIAPGEAHYISTASRRTCRPEGPDVTGPESSSSSSVRLSPCDTLLCLLLP
jgi:hypothetical protein